jgi:hypothetical protein
MNNFTKHIAALTCFAVLIGSGCKKFLDQVPDDRQTIEQVFQSASASKSYLANIYNYIPDETDTWDRNAWGTNADEMLSSWGASLQVNAGNYGPANVVFDFWNNYYKGIRSATYFINHIDGNVEMKNNYGQALIDRYKAEARFLRAYYYFLILRSYGPCVIIGNQELPIDAPAGDLQLPRSPLDSCVDYIVSELDAVAPQLPLIPLSDQGVEDKQGNLGRATRGAALAIKARTLLYAASPIYNGNTEYANFKNIDGKQLISQNYDVNKWKKAADAAKVVIDLNQYSLYKNSSNDVIRTLRGIHLDPWNNEIIFARTNGDWRGRWDTHAEPREAGGWCGLAPTQEMIDAFFMKDGMSIIQSPLYTESGFTNDAGGRPIYNMYLNREPRFYAAITYNLATWQGGNMTSTRAIDLTFTGANTKKGVATDWSRTGYLIRKMVAPESNAGTNGNGATLYRPVPMFRLGEIYLNYVEALNEFSPGHADILTYLNAIRARAGVPGYGVSTVPGIDPLPLPANQAEARKLIRAERRIELAFECHRWFDIRRWKILQETTGALHGMDVSKSAADGFYTRVTADTRPYRQAFYLWPISQYEMDRGKMLVQNPNW